MLLCSWMLSAQDVPAEPCAASSGRRASTGRPRARRETSDSRSGGEQLALKNNPQISQAQYRAKAYDEITREFRAAYFPTLQGNITAVGADSGSRLAAGARTIQLCSTA